jgi:replicative DNA helicase
LSQLNRANDRENRQPKLTDLRDSGTIEQDANTVILINREAQEIPDGTLTLTNKTQVNIAKQRDGACGSVNLTFIPSMSYFVNFIDEGRYMGKNFNPPV